MTALELKRAYPELHRLWVGAPMVLGLDVPDNWVRFAEYVRKSSRKRFRAQLEAAAFEKWFDGGPYGNVDGYVYERMKAAWMARAGGSETSGTAQPVPPQEEK